MWKTQLLLISSSLCILTKPILNLFLILMCLVGARPREGATVMNLNLVSLVISFLSLVSSIFSLLGAKPLIMSLTVPVCICH